MSNIDIQFVTNFKIAVKALHINGTYPTMVHDRFWLVRCVLLCFAKIVGLYLVVNSILFHDIRKGNFTEACKNIAMVVIGLSTLMKFVCLLYYRESILGLIRSLDDDYDVAKQLIPDEQVIVKRYAEEGRLVCLFWLVCSSSGSLIFPLKALLQTAHSFWIGENKLVLVFDCTFPDILEKHKDQLPTFCLLSGVCLAFAFCAAVMLIGFDPFIPIFALHTCGQLDILGQRLTTTLSAAASAEERDLFLRDVNIKLQQLYRRVDRVQKNFVLLNEFNMKSTTIILPLIAFHVVEDIRHNIINYEFFILFIGAAIHFMMPCYYSDLLMERSEAFRQSIYNCGWEKFSDKSLRQTILLMLTRATRPLGISTVFNTISLDTFASMIRQSYSIFNLMNAAWAE